VEDYGVAHLGVRGKRSQDVTVQEHLDVLVAAQQHVDSAVSKTCNVPGNTPWADFKRIYTEAWERGCKGCTTFNAQGKRMGVLVAKDDSVEDGPACRIDTTTGRRECE
jgi:ribonucleoside-diphosphate reductase alpha chain